MNKPDNRLAAAMEYARGKLLRGDRVLEIVSQISPRTGKKLTAAQILSEVDFWKLWETDMDDKLPEEVLVATYHNIKDPEAERVMITEAIKYLHSPGLRLAPDRVEAIIRELIIGILEDHRRRISPKRGRKAEKNSLRDEHIAKVAKGVCAFGFEPTKNRSPKTPRESGCSIVAKVLADAGVKKLGEQAVEKIWRKSGETAE